MPDLKERLTYRPEQDLSRLVSRYLADDSCDYDRHTRKHFQIATEKPQSFRNHPTVLACSFGGSKMKMMLASTQGGHICAQYLREVTNPSAKIHFYDYLDELFIKDERIYHYLKDSSNPSVCMSLPVMIGEDNIPFHPHKIGGIEGMMARTPEQMTGELHLGKNMQKYFASRKLGTPNFYYQSDPMTAHIGGLSLVDLERDERSILLVCGTGMATADDNYQRVVSLLPILDYDDELYPRDETDGYHYEHGCSGMGIFGIMNRAIRIRSRERDSVLGKYDFRPFFKDLYDSKTVADLWKSAISDEMLVGNVRQIHEMVEPRAFKELQWIASMINDRIIGSLGNAVLAAAVKINAREGKSRYYVMFEGSVALDKYRLPLIKAYITDRLQDDALFKKLGILKPDVVLDDRPRKEIYFNQEIVPQLREKIEITLIGTITMMIADNILKHASLRTVM